MMCEKQCAACGVLESIHCPVGLPAMVWDCSKECREFRRGGDDMNCKDDCKKKGIGACLDAQCDDCEECLKQKQ